MFGKNPIEPNENKLDGNHLRVVKGSPFSTVQGEGPFAGLRATFVRLHGCNLRCTFCDTEFSDPGDIYYTLRELLSAIFEHPAKLIVITGGEPLRQNIRPLCEILHDLEYEIQIETAGTLWVAGIEKFATIVVSPKTPTIHPEALRHAYAFKYVTDFRDGRDGYVPITATQPGASPRRLAGPREGAKVFVSPMDTGDETYNKTNRKLVGQLAQKYHGVTAGLQLHKFMDLD
jgi:organic radical activating enzyme